MTNGNDSVNFVPDTINANGEVFFGTQGLTKREYFAVMILQGLLSNNTYSSNKRVNASMLVHSAVGATSMLIEELNKGVK